MRIAPKSVPQRLLSAGLAREIDALEVAQFRAQVRSRVALPLLARHRSKLYPESSLKSIERAFAAGCELVQVVLRNPRTGDERVIVIPSEPRRDVVGAGP